MDSNGSKPSIAINSDGTPSIAYLLEDMPGFVKYASLGSNGWEVSTVSTGYFYGPLDIRIDVNDIPHITWHNHDTENEAYAVLSDGEWRVQDIDDPGHDGWDNNVAIDLSGRPHTVSIDPSQFGSQSGVEYATLEGDIWNVEEIGSGPIPYEFGTGIALDEMDRPHVVWYDDSNGELKYAIKDGSDWKISTIDSDGDVDVLDALRTLKIAVGLVVPTPQERIAADVQPDNDPDPDGDGDVDALDALRILKKSVGLVTITSCGGQG